VDRIFFTGVFIILLIFIGVVWLLSDYFHYNSIIINSLIISGIITVTNIVVAFLIVKYSIKKSIDTFNKAFLISMGVRFIVLLGVIFVILKFAEVHQLAFLVSLFLLYFTFQFWELIVINKYLEKGKVT
jgi:hypothetical protein